MAIGPLAGLSDGMKNFDKCQAFLIRLSKSPTRNAQVHGGVRGCSVHGNELIRGDADNRLIGLVPVISLEGDLAFRGTARANLQPVTRLDRIPRQRVDKFAERRAELAEAALQTLSELGYARTSLREIAQNSEFTHGVLHYYFRDKVDLILCSVRQYKARCVTRYDRVTADAKTYEDLMTGFLCGPRADDARRGAYASALVRYSLADMFETAFREDVAELDKSLEDMIWRIMCRFAELTGEPQSMPPSTIYAMIDGLFQQCLLKHLSGDPHAIDQMQAESGWSFRSREVAAPAGLKFCAKTSRVPARLSVGLNLLFASRLVGQLSSHRVMSG